MDQQFVAFEEELEGKQAEYEIVPFFDVNMLIGHELSLGVNVKAGSRKDSVITYNKRESIRPRR